MEILTIGILLVSIYEAIQKTRDKIQKRRSVYERYEIAIRGGFKYDDKVSSLAQMAHCFLLYSIARFNDGHNSEYGFKYVCKEYNIVNEKRFLQYVVNQQAHYAADPFKFHEVEFLLKM